MKGGSQAGAGVGRPPSHETKFVGPIHAASGALSLLRCRCRPDPEYAEGRVESVYFDTPDLRSLRDKVDSDYLKLKVRMRWYRSSRQAPSGPVWLEIKRKTGARRDKSRLRLPVDAARLAAWPLSDPRWTRLLAQAGGPRLGLVAVLRPLLQLGFRRRRFVDPGTGSRLALDEDIRIVRVNPARLPRPTRRTAGVTVVEIKGPARDLPALSAPLQALGCRRRSFSKYQRAYEMIIAGSPLR